MHTIAPYFYLGPISYYKKLIERQSFAFDPNEHFVKQSYRNRACIYGANGKLNLIIPIQHQGEKKTMQQVRISNDSRWQKIHLKSIQSAYRTSAYFEFFEDEFLPFYEKKYDFLIDFTFEMHQKVCELLQIAVDSSVTEKYIDTSEITCDLRTAFSTKKKLATEPVKAYSQVFEEKQGFIADLSIVDLLFNQGPNALSFIE